MTYEESAALMTDIPFRGRIKVASIKFVTYVFNEASSAQGHAARYRWGQTFITNPDFVSSQIQPMVVMDVQVQADGAEISDANLQTAVEAVINKVA